jgi:hypothetical protein
VNLIAEDDILAHADAILAAAVQFRCTSEDLMMRLSKKIDIPRETFYSLDYKPLLRRGWFSNKWKGWLDSRWRYVFHGYECGFINQTTGQDVDVVLGFPREFGVLDPYFFFRFVKTTPGLESVAALFTHGFHDPLRTFEILEQQGYLTRITDGQAGRTGLVARRP